MTARNKGDQYERRNLGSAPDIGGQHPPPGPIIAILGSLIGMIFGIIMMLLSNHIPTG